MPPPWTDTPPWTDAAAWTDAFFLVAHFSPTMRVRDWQDILEDVVESDADPAGWRAVGGDRASGIGEDLFVGHPDAGVFQLKTYAKNPFEVQGVGARVARRIDEDIDPLFPGKDDSAGDNDLRKDVMEGMKDRKLEDYESEIERYYKSIVE